MDEHDSAIALPWRMVNISSKAGRKEDMSFNVFKIIQNRDSGILGS